MSSVNLGVVDLVIVDLVVVDHVVVDLVVIDLGVVDLVVVDLVGLIVVFQLNESAHFKSDFCIFVSGIARRFGRS